jgi:LPS O-antigen subunit length determinant protein (WzzB/FepE family)
MAAELAKASETMLQEAVINYKIQNAKEQLEFTEERFNEKKIEFDNIQSRLSSFKDRNQNIISAAVLSQQEKLEAEYDFAFSIYTELAKQLEQAKLQVAKDTPVFSIIQEVTIPVQKSSPNRPMIVIVFAIIGIGLFFGIVLVKEIWSNLKEDWSEVI